MPEQLGCAPTSGECLMPLQAGRAPVPGSSELCLLMALHDVFITTHSGQKSVSGFWLGTEIMPASSLAEENC